MNAVSPQLSSGSNESTSR